MIMQAKPLSLPRWLMAVALSLPPLAGFAADPLTLDAAIAHVAATHPDLRLIGAQSEILAAERDLASQKPAWSADVQVENAFGTREAKAFDEAEFTLTLSSVLEGGGKLDARRALAQSRFDALVIERETRRLDLLAETARRYLAVVGAQRQFELADLACRIRFRMRKSAALGTVTSNKRAACDYPAATRGLPDHALA